MRIHRSLLVAVALAAPGSITAQGGARGVGGVAATRTAPAEIIVKTVNLRHITSLEAQQLLSPYVQTSGGGVYAVPNVQAVTIREIPRVFAEMEKVLAAYDRSPATVTLNFQLIAAEPVGARDPAVAGLDSLLRGVLKFSGYRLLRTTVANASENARMSQSLAAEGETYTLTVHVAEIRSDGPDASVRLTVQLEKDMFVTTPAGKTQVPGKELLSTGVSVPIGHTVVLGAAAADNADRALILTVRPQLAEGKR